MSRRPAPPRIRPLADEDFGPRVREALAGTYQRVAEMEGRAPSSTPAHPKTLGILRTIAHDEKLLGPFLGFATAVAREGSLSRRDSELLALRTAWNCRSDFEWGHHAVFGRAAGLTADEIARIAVGPDARGWSEADRALLVAADQLHARQQIDDDTWDRLAKGRSDAQLVEVPFVVGQYTMLSMVANATGVELEPGFEPLPEVD